MFRLFNLLCGKMIITGNSRGEFEVNERERRMSELLKHIENRAKVRGPTALAAHINSSLSSGTKISKESVRRWLKGEQVPSEEKKKVFARAISCPVEILDSYLDGGMPAVDFFGVLDTFESQTPDEALIYQEICDKASHLSLPWLGQAIAVLGDMFSSQWGKSGLAPDLVQQIQAKATISPKIRDVVREHWQSCVDFFEEGATFERLQAIADGKKPSGEDLDLIHAASNLEIEYLIKITKEEFSHGCVECRNNSN